MSTIAVSQKGYVGNEEKKVSLKEKMKKYFEENGATITAGLFLMNGSTSPYALYRMMK